jgi:predicted lipoprotein with Yx(FWY)xxD motif
LITAPPIRHAQTRQQHVLKGDTGMTMKKIMLLASLALATIAFAARPLRPGHQSGTPILAKSHSLGKEDSP